MRACGLVSLVGYFNVIICDKWEGNVTARSEIFDLITSIPWGFGIREGVTLWSFGAYMFKTYIN